MRAALTDYVRARGLVAAGRKGHVVLDGVLAAALGKQEQVRSPRLFRQKVVAPLTSRELLWIVRRTQ